MPPDSQLGRGLERVVADVDVDVRQSFAAVSRMARRKRVFRRSLFAAAAVVIAAGIAIGGYFAIAFYGVRTPPLRPVGPRPSPSTAALGHEAYARIAGTYVTTVPHTGGIASTYKVFGRWTMTLNRNGSVTFAAPFVYIRRAGPPELTSYSLAGSTLVTTALMHPGFGCDSSGVYRWTLDQGTLRFATLKDDCPYRPAVFASTPWKRR
ncbi:MAG: hypothetical protein M3290_08870 [Actinomycetota bacterium]|nr:hypothetical protein [Actinomycetota bacterium]